MKTATTFLQFFTMPPPDRLEPFILVIEGSIPEREDNKAEGYWAAFGADRETGQPIPTCDWIDRLAPKAWAVVAAGTCATYGGIHAMAGNPDRLHGPGGLSWLGLEIEGRHPDRQRAGLSGPARQFHGGAALPAESGGGRAPMIPLDEALRPTWLFCETVHEGCDRGGYYEQGDFAEEFGTKQCIVKLGCWGPVVQCNVGKRGWMDGIGGCPNVGGVCIGCTMPGFPDKFMPFHGPAAGLDALHRRRSRLYGNAIRALRAFTQASMNKEARRGRKTG